MKDIDAKTNEIFKKALVKVHDDAKKLKSDVVDLTMLSNHFIGIVEKAFLEVEDYKEKVKRSNKSPDFSINLAKAIANDVTASKAYKKKRKEAADRLMKAEKEVQAARQAYKDICEGD